MHEVVKRLKIIISQSNATIYQQQNDNVSNQIDEKTTLNNIYGELSQLIKNFHIINTNENESPKKMIQQFKLNHGLFLNGYSIKPSKQAVYSGDGKLNISLYKGQPLVYTFVNDHSSHTNLLSFIPDKTLRQSDICINFPVAEITYKADSLKTFSNSVDNDE